VLRHLGKFTEAEPLQRQAVELSEEMMGKNHPNTATYLGNLAQVSRCLGLEAHQLVVALLYYRGSTRSECDGVLQSWVSKGRVVQGPAWHALACINPVYSQPARAKDPC